MNRAGAQALHPPVGEAWGQPEPAMARRHARLARAPMVWLVSTLGLTIFFGAMAARDLDDVRPVSSDDVEIMAVSYKLATQGVLGSDPQAGFFHAEDHHFLTLPVQHVLQAVTFRAFGAGVPQARWVSVAAAASLIWSVGWLAWRWYGLGAAVLSEFLLVAWPSDLVPGSPGLPLVSVARTARYDVTAVAFIWLSLVLLDGVLRRPGRVRALASGLSAGLAALTQFFGLFALPLIALNYVWWSGRRAWRQPCTYWLLAGVGLLLVPYALYAAHFHDDLVGQWRVHVDRGIFGPPAFYLSNALQEPARYAHLQNLPLPGLRHPDALTRPLSPWLLIVGTPLALVWLGRRTWVTRAQGDRLLLSSLLVCQGLLAALDVTKAPLYAILLVPPVCLALAAFATAALGWLSRTGRGPSVRLISLGAGVAVLAIIAVEGGVAYQADGIRAEQTSSYLDLGNRMERSLPSGARVLGPERWWWPLHDHPYLALRNLWRQWEVAAAAGEQTPRFQDWVTRADSDFVVVNEDVRQDLSVYPQALQDQVWAFLGDCSTAWGDWTDPTYGEIELRQVIRPLPDGPSCKGASDP